VLSLLETSWPGGYELEESAGSNFYPLPNILARPSAALFPGMAVTFFLLLRKTRPYDESFLTYPMECESNFFVGEGAGHHVS
jgi:hypothetical protein